MTNVHGTRSPSFSSRSSLVSSSSYLPTPVTHRNNCMSAAVKRYRYLRRLLKFDQMDFEFAFWQMTYLFISPQQVFRNFQYRKQTKSQFARDDPAFLVLLTFWLCMSSLGFTLVLGLSLGAFFRFLLYIIFVDCIFVGFCVATILWVISNKYLVKAACRPQDVEWAYAFDVHLNAFFPPLIILHIFQLFIYQVLLGEEWFVSRLVGNSLWLLSFAYYTYITFLGYCSLPIVERSQVLLYPLVPVVLIYFLTLYPFSWNITKSVMNFYRFRVT